MDSSTQTESLIVPARNYSKDPNLLTYKPHILAAPLRTALPTFFRSLALLIIYGGGATALLAVVYRTFLLPRITRMSSSMQRIYSHALTKQQLLVSLLSPSHEVSPEPQDAGPKSPSDNLLEQEGGLAVQDKVDDKVKITNQLSTNLRSLAEELKAFNDERRTAPRPTSDLIKTTVDFSGQISQYNFINSRSYATLPASVTSGMGDSFRDTLSNQGGTANEVLNGCKSEIRALKGFMLSRRNMGY